MAVTTSAIAASPSAPRMVPRASASSRNCSAMRLDMFSSRNSTATGAACIAAASASTVVSGSTARMTRGTSLASTRLGMCSKVKMARRTWPAKTSSRVSSPSSTFSRVVAVAAFRIAPTRSAGLPSKAGADLALNSPSSWSPTRAMVAGSTAPVSETAWATIWARSSGRSESRAAAFETGSLASRMAQISALSRVTRGRSWSASIPASLRQGSGGPSASARSVRRWRVSCDR